MKVFLAMPYSQLCDTKKYEVKKEYKSFFKIIIDGLKKEKIEYFLAHERENWGKNYSSAEESVMIDFEEIKAASLVCVIPGVPNSGGVHVEIGWASANNRKMKIFLKNNYNYSPMVTGVHCLTDVDYYYYDDDYSEELAKLILKEIISYMKGLK